MSKRSGTKDSESEEPMSRRSGGGTSGSKSTKQKPTGKGSLGEDSRVYVNGTLMSMKEIFTTLTSKSSKEADDEEGAWYQLRKAVTLNSINDAGKVVEVTTKSMYRNRIESRLTSVELANGLRIRVTQNLKFYTRDGWIAISELKAGMLVAIPSKLIEYEDGDGINGEEVTKELAEFLSWQISEGYERPNNNGAAITQKDTTVLDRLMKLFKRISVQYELEINKPSIDQYSDRPAYLRLNSSGYRQLLEKYGYRWGELSAGKYFPNFIMQAGDAVIILFIRAYMDADACFTYKKGVIELTSASRELVLQMFTLLKRFSINSRILYKRKCATNGARILRDYYELHISGPSLRLYCKKIGFGVSYKQKGLIDVCENRKTNTNTEIVPMQKELVMLKKKTAISMPKITNKTNFSGITNPSVTEAKLILGRANDLLAMPEDQNILKDKGPRYYMTDAHKKNFRIFRNFLKAELAKQVCYIAIKSIQKINYEGYVYDFQVKCHSNFVAEGILCRNAHKQS